jgi:hypothetical protein
MIMGRDAIIIAVKFNLISAILARIIHDPSHQSMSR